MRELAAGLALCAALNAGFFAAWTPPPRPIPLKLDPETAIESAGLLSLGMRRVAADAGMIRLLIYYGTVETGSDEEAAVQGGGSYPEIGARARRILALDPTFSYASLWAAGALAFNLKRPDEALALLDDALKADPGNWKYRAYVAAIGFKKKGDSGRVLALLEPTLSQPDCPTMIKSMVAFLYERAGRRDDAIRVYREILATSRDEGYRHNARRKLEELGVSPH